ncbi:shikimate dehydrogenase [Solirubrobacter sp. CPCC 204708]|uniref:Shikimate dehydrogenase (NADP(+)) n=1 Tax=Solirubrobacter deserti TaxID=2282478 RepID=A0ABT4RSP9_9ACTN|nr:shikimate dehydrogenase [Solirubrobacter deserti]MBE2315915.1 shikimate dehydrogenase [Solirubrobacter deserti]MDA0141594.1 shikimate dehydrogenase [Solirubrobacter deserti]
MAERDHVVGLIGAGIDASLSPALHEAEAAAQGLDYEYRLLDIDGRELGALLEQARAAGFSGVNVTHPCKQDVVPFLDELSPEAAALDAVNTVVFRAGRAIGHNTDASGFAESFRRGLPHARLGKVVVLGAGGAGSAVAHAALRLGARELVIVDVDSTRAAALANRLGARTGALDSVQDADGLIHATPTGMAAHPGLPLPEELLRPELWVAEVVYRPLETELVKRARELGCRTLDGGGMAVMQAAGAFERFTGVEPDRERMLRHFATLVEPVSAR